jgi:tRNA (cytidine/uridine-2'-O-)-methyltransferase
MALNIVLVEPEIPQNTGNIVRTCAATGAVLHLVGPLGFSIEDKYLKRAGLDYWNEAEIKYYDSFDEFIKNYGDRKMYYSTTKAIYKYSDVKFEEDCFILFGKETAGLPEELLKQNKETCIRIPMKESIRSLNLSNSVAIVVYEALRQQNFIDMETQGHLVRYDW